MIKSILRALVWFFGTVWVIALLLIVWDGFSNDMERLGLYYQILVTALIGYAIAGAALVNK